MNKILLCVAAGLLLLSCHLRQHPFNPAEKHQAAVKRPGAMLYVDRADNRMVMQATPGLAGNFSSFRIGWADSLTAAEPNRQKERYFQYQMQQDWRALVNGDTLYPVFFQEKPGLNQQLKEGVIVFENAQGVQPDTLVYRDSFGNWGTQIFVLNRN